MWQQKPHFENIEELDPLHLEHALLASDVAAWRLNSQTGEFIFSKQFPHVFPPNVLPFKDVNTLFALLPTADRYIFTQTFNSNIDDTDEKVRACEVKILVSEGDIRIRFIGRLMSINNSGRFYEGVVVSNHHWLANPGAEVTNSLLGKLFADHQLVFT
ncbi:MAG: hypothetical protein EOO68_17765, partial [Moraxellaceae bacterium]